MFPTHSLGMIIEVTRYIRPKRSTCHRGPGRRRFGLRRRWLRRLSPRTDSNNRNLSNFLQPSCQIRGREGFQSPCFRAPGIRRKDGAPGRLLSEMPPRISDSAYNIPSSSHSELAAVVAVLVVTHMFAIAMTKCHKMPSSNSTVSPTSQISKRGSASQAGTSLN